MNKLWGKEQWQKEFNDYLLKALEEPRVIEKIENLFNDKGKSKEKMNQKDIEHLKEKIKENKKNIITYKEIIEQKNKEIEDYKEVTINKDNSLKYKENIIQEKDMKIRQLEFINKQVNLENENKEIQITSMQKELQQQLEEIQRVRQRFEEAEQIYKVFLNLSLNRRDALKGLFRGSTIEEFIFCGVQYENIDALWDFIKREVMEGTTEEIESLIEIFDYFFQAYNKTFEAPIYIRMDVEVGKNFDTEQHIAGRSSKPSGEIKKVVLNGYINKNTNKIIKKTIIII